MLSPESARSDLTVDKLELLRSMPTKHSATRFAIELPSPATILNSDVLGQRYASTLFKFILGRNDHHDKK